MNQNKQIPIPLKILAITLEDINTIFRIRDSVKENYLSNDQVTALGITPSSLKNMLLTDCAGWIAFVGDDDDAGFIIADKNE